MRGVFCQNLKQCSSRRRCCSTPVFSWRTRADWRIRGEDDEKGEGDTVRTCRQLLSAHVWFTSAASDVTEEPLHSAYSVLISNTNCKPKKTPKKRCSVYNLSKNITTSAWALHNNTGGLIGSEIYNKDFMVLLQKCRAHLVLGGNLRWSQVIWVPVREYSSRTWRGELWGPPDPK